MMSERYTEAIVDGDVVRVVHPSLFHAAATVDPRKGLGLFCRVDLEPGDCWWAHAFDDPRYVTRVIPWAEYERLGEAEQCGLQVLSYIDVATRSLVVCTEPFCRVNHGGRDANSISDDSGCSLVTRPIPAGTEITIPYDYDPVLSILWKFPELTARLSPEVLADERVMFGPIGGCEPVKRFLEELG